MYRCFFNSNPMHQPKQKNRMAIAGVILSLAIFLLCSFSLFSQPVYSWASRIGGNGFGNDDAGNSIALDASGNVYITGYFSGINVDFDPGAGVQPLSSKGNKDTFVAKYNSSGAYVWAFSIGGFDGGFNDAFSNDQGKSIAVDGSGNVYITGFFGVAGGISADFDPSGATNNITSNGSIDIFCAKYNSSGAYVWAFDIGSSGNDEGASVAVDVSGNVFIGGYYSGTADFDPSGTIQNLVSPSSTSEGFFAKYNSSGNYIWAKRVGSNSGDRVNGIAINSAGTNVYITGYYQDVIDMDPDAGTQNLTYGPGDLADMFFAKYDVNGAYVWAKSTVGNNTWSQGNGITTDASGNVYVTGYFQLTVDFDPDAGVQNVSAVSANDIFFAKYNSNGAYAWAKDVGGVGNNNDYGNSIVVHPNGNVFVTGGYNDSGIFLGRYDANGNLICKAAMGACEGTTQGNGIAVDANGNVVVTGSFNATVDFDPGAGTQNRSTWGDCGGGIDLDIFYGKYSMVCGVSLPVELLSFTGKNDGEKNILDWATATEINNDYFIIERSADGKTFEEIGTVQGAGNSSSQKNYEFTDNSEPQTPYSELIYYRLRQVDYDGKYEYSPIISINLNSENYFNAYYNPAGYIVVLFDIEKDDSPVSISLCDLLGKKQFELSKKYSKGIQQVEIPANNFSSGIFLVNIVRAEKNLSRKILLGK